jgi:trehalose/maltose transport system substrate-binding protein
MARTRCLQFVAVLVVLSLVLSACDLPGFGPPAAATPPPRPNGTPGPVTLRFLADNTTALGLPLDQQAATEFTQQTGIRVEVIAGPPSTTARLAKTQLYLAAESPDVDVYQIDVIWPGLLAGDLLDLRPYIPAAQLAGYFPAGIQNNTVGGRLVALPYFTDAGLLYYRTDLLQKYGIAGPPATWDALETAAQRIQDGERAAGNAAFWGFVWQGNAYEGLTCDALEWQVSQGGGAIIAADGTVTVDNQAAVGALDRARSWIGRISPPSVLTYQEAEADKVWRSGNAAFMRNWSSSYAAGNQPDPQTGQLPPIAGKFAIAPLPAGGTTNSRPAATLGGWQLAVSRYSAHPREAAQFVAFLAASAHQKVRAIQAGYLPTIGALYHDPGVLAANPYVGSLAAIFSQTVARPSAVAGAAYDQVSAAYFTAVHMILTGEVRASDGLRSLREQLVAILAARPAP